METKICSKCKGKKSIKLFYKTHPHCKLCLHEASKKYYHNNKEREREKSKKYQEDNKEKIKLYKKLYRKKNKEDIKNKQRIYHFKNRKIKSFKAKQGWKDNINTSPEIRAEYLEKNRRYRAKHRERLNLERRKKRQGKAKANINKQQRLWYKNNIQKIIARRLSNNSVLECSEIPEEIILLQEMILLAKKERR